MINSYDIITYLPPKELGFKRLGKEYDIYDENVIDLVLDAYPDASFPKFSEKFFNIMAENYYSDKKDGTKDAKEFIAHLMTYLTTELHSNDGETSITNRADLGAFLELGLGNISEMISDENIEKFKALKDDTTFMFQVLMAAASTTDEDALYNTLSAKLTEIEIAYNEETLKPFCNILQKVLAHTLVTQDERGSAILDYIITIVGNMDYIYAMHCPETTFTLLKNYEG